MNNNWLYVLVSPSEEDLRDFDASDWKQFNFAFHMKGKILYLLLRNDTLYYGQPEESDDEFVLWPYEITQKFYAHMVEMIFRKAAEDLD